MKQGRNIPGIILLLIAACTIIQVSAQPADPGEAKEHFKNRNYSKALKVYKRLIKQEPSNPDFQRKAGACYLRSNVDKTKAIPFLEKAIESSKVNIEAFFDLGLAYQHAYRYEEALKMFERYKENASSAGIEKTERQIETCHSGKALRKRKINVEFENLGPKINTPFPDYYPFVAKDESFLVFTARKLGNTGGVMEFDGFYSSDVWISQKVDGKFSKARNAGHFVNSEYDEQAVGLSDDGKTLFVYVDKIKEYGDIYTATRKTKSFPKIEKLGETVNSPQLETAASISADGNTLFFASNKQDPNSQGGLDLYMTRKLPTGEWALPQNLGVAINTKYNEDFPTLSADGQTLYFCSEGHESMGGYDIFKATWDPETNSWSKPQNIGYPINTPDNERVISFTEDGIHAYISAVRDGGFGDLDIYRITFKEKLPVAIVLLKLPSNDPANPYLTDAFVAVYDNNNEEIGSYLPNPRNGTFTIALEPGIYNLEIEAAGYKFHTEKLIVLESDAIMGLMMKEVTLSPQ